MGGHSWTEKASNKRRKHKNSKLGCPNCKKRRVKCFENLPSCTNCIKHKVRCGYLDYTEEQLEELKATLKQRKEYQNKVKVNGKQKATSDAENTSGEIEIVSERNGSSEPGSHETERRDDQSGRHSVSNGIETNRSLSVSSGNSGVNNVFNFQQHGVTQDFDNLLFTKENDDLSIIYPVYSLYQKAESDQVSDSLSKDDLIASGDLFNTRVFDDQVLGNNKFVSEFYNPTKHAASCLPNAIVAAVSFSILTPDDIDYEKELFNCLEKLKVPISQGTSTLPQIRQLYFYWLHSFFYKSPRSSIMVSCLLNLTINYLIVNSFNSSYSHFVHLVDEAKTRNALIVVSVQHYARVVKGLRMLLNNNEDPLLCYSVSYILSMMAVYDPEATLHSSNCFTSGTFCVLHHHMSKSSTKPFHSSTFMRLLHNFQRSIYLPAYEPVFLDEIRAKLLNFGNIISSVQSLADNRKLDFVQKKYIELLNFTNSAIDDCIPKINANLSDMQAQQEILFDMMYKWVRLVPSSLLSVSRESDPFEKILYLFIQVIQKAFSAVIPQTKFFFSRDFDSPLILDVVDSIGYYEIYDHYINKPVSTCIPSGIYDSLKILLVPIAGYLVRLLQFMKARTAILYRSIVSQKITSNFPIDDVRKWKSSIVDVQVMRQKYAKFSGVSEIPIKSFSKTLIKEYHYPKFNNSKKEAGYVQDEQPDLDFSQLQSDCHLAKDYRIGF